MKITKEQLLGYSVICFFFILFGFTVEFPLFGLHAQKETLFQSSSILEIFLILLVITIVYFVLVHFIPLDIVVKQVKSYRKPMLKLHNEKFQYWLKSELYEQELKEQQHLDAIDYHVNVRETEKIEVLKKAAELNDMTMETYTKTLKGQAEANLINAKSEVEKSKALILLKGVKIIHKMSPMWQAYIISCVTNNESDINKDLELQKEIDQIIKDKSSEELRTMKLENNNKEEKFNRNKRPKDEV